MKNIMITDWVQVLRAGNGGVGVTIFRVKETKRGNITRPSRAQIMGSCVTENANMPLTLLSLTPTHPAGASHWQTSVGSQEIREQGYAPWEQLPSHRAEPRIEKEEDGNRG